MNGSTATTSVLSSIVAPVHFEPELLNLPDTSSPTGTGSTTLDHIYHVMIEVDPDQRHNGRPQPFWKGFVLEYEDPIGHVIVAFARAVDAGTASRSKVIAKLNEVVCRNGYLVDGAEDLSTGKPIEGMPLHVLKNISRKPAILPW
jgi:hypothetical protein